MFSKVVSKVEGTFKVPSTLSASKPQKLFGKFLITQCATPQTRIISCGRIRPVGGGVYQFCLNGVGMNVVKTLPGVVVIGSKEQVSVWALNRDYSIYPAIFYFCLAPEQRAASIILFIDRFGITAQERTDGLA